MNDNERWDALEPHAWTNHHAAAEALPEMLAAKAGSERFRREVIGTHYKIRRP